MESRIIVANDEALISEVSHAEGADIELVRQCAREVDAKPGVERPAGLLVRYVRQAMRVREAQRPALASHSRQENNTKRVARYESERADPEYVRQVMNEFWIKFGRPDLVRDAQDAQGSTNP